jgi:hypothetical protein
MPFWYGFIELYVWVGFESDALVTLYKVVTQLYQRQSIVVDAEMVLCDLIGFLFS